MLNGNIRKDEALIWHGWAQSVSVLFAHRQTSTMFYASARRELSVFGLLLYQVKDGRSHPGGMEASIPRGSSTMKHRSRT